MRKWLAVHGRSHSGKSTLSRSLSRLGYSYVNFTDYLKVLYVQSLNAVGVPVTLAEVIANKNQERPHIISFGTRIGFDSGKFIPQLLDDELGSIRDYWPEQIVFDNVRFPGQMDRLQEMGFILVRLEIDDFTQEERARQTGMPWEKLMDLRYEDSEQPLPRYAGEIVLDANRPADLVLRDLLAILNAREYGGPAHPFAPAYR